MRFRSAGACAAVMVSVLAVGCQGSPEPATLEAGDPTKTATPSGTPSPTSTSSPDSTKPGEVLMTKGPVDPKLAADAEAFVQSFMKAYDRAAASGEFSAVDAMYSDACHGCKSYVSYLKKVYRDGARIEGGSYVDPTFKTVGAAGADVTVQVDSTISAYKIVGSSGDTIDSKPAEADTSSIVVQQESSGWQVTGWS